MLSTPAVDQVQTSGPRPNTEFLASSLGANVLDERKFVIVSQQLRVIDHPSVFVAGDIVGWEEEKQFAKTVGQAAVVAENIISHLANKPLKKLYTGSPEMLILTNGKVWISASFHMNVSDYLAPHTPVVWHCLLSLPMGTCFRSMVCPHDQVENTSSWTCAF